MSSTLEKSKEMELLEVQIREEYRKLWDILNTLAYLYKQYDVFKNRNNEKNNCTMTVDKIKETRCEECEY